MFTLTAQSIDLSNLITTEKKKNSFENLRQFIVKKATLKYLFWFMLNNNVRTSLEIS